jgi:hypothetical protein
MDTSFKFTDVQRQALLKCWKRKSERTQAAVFLNAAELTISDWLPRTNSPPTSARERIKHARRIHKAALEMRSALEEIPQDVARALACYQAVEVEQKECSKMPPDLNQLSPLIDYLQSLVLSSGVMERHEKREKQWQNKHLEKSLAFFLASIYSDHFGKHPSAANGSSFRLFAAGLSKILGYDLGAIVVAGACKTVRNFAI